MLEAEQGTELIVLEMAMRGMGQIRDLARIARPDVGVITNVGPVHLELVGTVENVARAKAELIAELAPGAACVVPAGRRRCGRTCARTAGPDVRCTFVGGVEAIAGAAADVRALAVEPRGEDLRVDVAAGAERARPSSSTSLRRTT